MSAGRSGALSEREAALLDLLASGHTVKSAIAETGDSEAAAHELLRTARRKLGVSSSREAARLYASGAPSQKTWDSLSGIEQPRRRMPSKASFVAGGIMLTFAALSLVLTSGILTEAKPGDEGVHIESTLPMEGAQIEPGPFILRVTFDRPMIGEIKSVYSPAADGSVPLSCQGPPEIGEDGRSFEQLCIAIPGATHQVWFGHEEMGSFRSEDGQSPGPLLLTFTVTAG